MIREELKRDENPGWDTTRQNRVRMEPWRCVVSSSSFCNGTWGMGSHRGKQGTHSMLTLNETNALFPLTYNFPPKPHFRDRSWNTPTGMWL